MNGHIYVAIAADRYREPTLFTRPEGRELVMARWGMPSLAFALTGKKSDPGVTNIRNTKSPHWRRWLGPDSRCVVPFTSFAEHELQQDGSRPPVWFALDDSRPLAFFAGVWTRWTSVRKVREGETTNDLFGFLTTEPNAEVKPIHPKAMPVILRTSEEIETWRDPPRSGRSHRLRRRRHRRAGGGARPYRASGLAAHRGHRLHPTVPGYAAPDAAVPTNA